MEEKKHVSLTDLINVYETDYTLPLGKKIKVKPITTGQLKTLLVFENESNPMIIEDALDRIISSSVTTPDFNIDTLTLQERMDLMLKLRNITKGSLYSFTHTCDKCGGDTLVSKDLNELPNIPPKELSLKLDINDRLSIVMEFPTRADQRKAYVYQDCFNEHLIIDSTKMADVATTTMAYAIRDVIIDGESSEYYKDDNAIQEKIDMLENLPRAVHDKLSKFFNENNFGTEFEFDYKCIHCGKVFNMTLPLNDFFV